MKVGLIFPGQGAQFPGMGKKLYDEFRSVRETFEEASDAIKVDIKKLCFESTGDKLKLTYNAQPAILTISISALRVLTLELEINPAIAGGHSLGEYSALCSANSIDFFSSIKVVRKRGEFMQECAPEGGSAMVAVIGIPSEEVESICKEISSDEVFPANYNEPNQTVIAGQENKVKEAVELIKQRKGKTVFLNVSAPFHTPFMKEAGDKLLEVLKHIKLKKPVFPVVRNVDGKVYTNEMEIPEILARQVYSPVRWVDCVKKIENEGVNILIEPGPREVLGNLVKKITHRLKSFKLTEPSDIKLIEKELKKCEV